MEFGYGMSHRHCTVALVARVLLDALRRLRLFALSDDVKIHVGEGGHGICTCSYYCPFFPIAPSLEAVRSYSVIRINYCL